MVSETSDYGSLNSKHKSQRKLNKFCLFGAFVSVCAIILFVNLIINDSYDSNSDELQSSFTSRCNSMQAVALEFCSVGLNCPSFKGYPIEISQKRVRRNIKYLNTSEYNALTNAMMIMKNMSMMEGKLKYGPAFRNNDYFVVKHVAAGFDLRGDQAHFSSAFITYHTLILLEYENSLIAVDPTIGAMPYWDWPDDSFSLFTADHFGELPGRGQNYEVTTSAFSGWIISAMNEEIWRSTYAPMMVNMSQCSYLGATTSGYFRDERVPVETPHLVRMGLQSSFENLTVEFLNCSSSSKFPLLEWYRCIEVRSSVS